jgi:L-lactate dehydrogenase complex protein LldG
VSDARRVILERIAAALADVPGDERPVAVPVPRDYRTACVRGGSTAAAGDSELVTRFAERVADYRAEVARVRPAEVAATLAAACADRGLRRLAVAPGLAATWRPTGPGLVDDDGLTAADLDELDGAVTGCAAAIAETGTILLDGSPRSGRRLLTLVPDHHLCVVEAAQIAAGVPEALAAVAPAAVGERRPITLVSGPSASSDIELARVEGVHGPRHLLVVIADPAAPAGAAATTGG